MYIQNSAANKRTPAASHQAFKMTQEDRGIALRIFDRIPANCLAFTVSGQSCAPLIRCGEVAVIDTKDNQPEDGALFLTRLGSDRNQHYKVLETFLRDCRIAIEGDFEQQRCWMLGDHYRPRSKEECVAWIEAGRGGAFCDGPFPQFDEGAAYLNKVLLGRVIGILVPEISSLERPSNSNTERTGAC